MGKVLKLQDVITKDEWISAIVASLGPCKSASVIIENQNGEILTAYWDCSFAQKMVLMGHMNADIINDMIVANYVTG